MSQKFIKACHINYIRIQKVDCADAGSCIDRKSWPSIDVYMYIVCRPKLQIFHIVEYYTLVRTSVGTPRSFGYHSLVRD